MYRRTLRPLLFRLDPEALHRLTIAAARQFGRTPIAHPLLRIWHPPTDTRLQQTLWGLSFAHPLGLAAGFDKNAEAIAAWPHLGFAFAEVGTITARAQTGNPQPRLFRLPADGAVLNRMGFNNRGAAAVAHQLEAESVRQHLSIPLGINLGKSKITPLEEAADDYAFSFEQLYAFGDYFVVNVSSPNTPGLRQLQAKDALRDILMPLQARNRDRKPILVKIAPDLNEADIDDLLTLVEPCQIAGIIATNTTLSRDRLTTQRLAATGKSPQDESGGISGKPLRSRSTEVIARVWQQTAGCIPIIGVGGIDSAEAAWEKITAGASLLQIYTGLVYEGPALIEAIVTGLSAKLAASGYDNIHEAIGSQHR
ncbi:MAG: quinone-dependent dihydroorotate dehydrogenase [Cyanobacteria bacterium P01_E01_bin.48]